jgi:hypothetical protein
MIFAIGKRSKFSFSLLVASRLELEMFVAMGNGRIREGLIRLALPTRGHH